MYFQFDKESFILNSLPHYFNEKYKIVHVSKIGRLSLLFLTSLSLATWVLSSYLLKKVWPTFTEKLLLCLKIEPFDHSVWNHRMKQLWFSDVHRIRETSCLKCLRITSTHVQDRGIGRQGHPILHQSTFICGDYKKNLQVPSTEWTRAVSTSNKVYWRIGLQSD